jgi:hypothetical protein
MEFAYSKRKTASHKPAFNQANRRFNPSLVSQHPQIRKILAKPRIQARFNIGKSNDQYEQEADKVADAIVSNSAVHSAQHSTVQQQANNSAPMANINGNEGGSKENDRELSSGKPGSKQQQISPLSGGQQLSKKENSYFTARFGTDFSAIRIHNNPAAHQMADTLNAKAFTLQNNIVFAKDQYNFDSAAGKHLLAHELTHSIQQGAVDNPTHSASPQVTSTPSTGNTIQRQATTTSTQGSVGSVSWIDSSSPAGSQVSDPAPGATITESFITGSSGFRFSNYLKASVTSTDGRTISSSTVDPISGIYTAPSFAGIPSYRYPRQRSSRSISNNGINGMEFEQTVGARTISAGVIGGATGTAVGAVAGALIGAGIGYLAGTAVVNQAMNFPPIWTKLRLKLFADGTKDQEVVGHSHFPSSYYYRDLSRFDQYSALASQQRTWENSGWGSGNPWGASRPSITP